MFTNEKKTRVEILKFESKKMRVELKKKYSSRERENAVFYRCLHFTDTRLRSNFFFSLGRLIEDLERQLSSASLKWQFRILISAPWRVQKDTCNSAVKILWDLRLFRNREVHPFYVKSDWNPPVQPLEALKRGQLAEQGHPTTIFGRISVRKTIWDLEFSKHLL